MKIKELDAASLSPRELNSQVKESAKDYDKILIKNPNAIGVMRSVSIVSAGNAAILAFFLSKPYPENENPKNKAIYGNFP